MVKTIKIMGWQDPSLVSSGLVCLTAGLVSGSRPLGGVMMVHLSKQDSMERTIKRGNLSSSLGLL